MDETSYYDEGEWYTSQEYLNLVMDLTHSGYPDRARMIALKDLGEEVELTKQTNQMNQDVMDFFRQNMNNALSAYYPEGGFISWHNNWNAPGCNLIITHNNGGYGYFRYLHPISKKIITLEDPPGWSVKISHFPPIEDLKHQVWHCARTVSGSRMTYSWIVGDGERQQRAVEKLISN